MLNDLRFAFRTLSRTPIVTLMAILSLALGIGGNTAMFSMLAQILLRGLPVPRSGELVYSTANGPRSGSNSNNNAGSGESIFSFRQGLVSEEPRQPRRPRAAIATTRRKTPSRLWAWRATPSTPM